MVRAIRSLGIDAHVNDRNDICVGEEKMSVLFRFEENPCIDTMRFVPLFRVCALHVLCTNTFQAQHTESSINGRITTGLCSFLQT